MSRISRLLRILKIIGYYRLDELIPKGALPRVPANLLRINPWKLRYCDEASRGARLRRGLEDLGPIYIKFGQALSTRRDLLPAEIASELAKLVDSVPPFPDEQAVSIVERELKGKTTTFFSKFDESPIASASVAQVHSATLKDGRDVVVKIIRPEIENIIHQDIDLLFIIARLAEKYLKDGQRLRLLEVVANYKATILNELDLAREAANASQLGRNFENRSLVYVPEVVWEYTSGKVFVMERISGIPISDLNTLKNLKVNLKLLAERGVEIFFTQVFTDNFFHADMHPGNIFVDVSNPEDPTYISIDCAIIGSLSDEDQYYLARNLLAIFKRNYQEVAELHLECGWIPNNADIKDFESTIRTLCEPIFDRPLKEISFAQLLVNLFKTGRRYNMEIQPSLILLQKTLLNIEGLGRELYPDLNLWETALPFLEAWLKKRYSVITTLERIQTKIPSLLEKMPELPDKIYSSLSESKKLKIEIESLRAEYHRLEEKTIVERSSRRRSFSAIMLLMLLVTFFQSQNTSSAFAENYLAFLIPLSLILLYLGIRS